MKVSVTYDFFLYPLVPRYVIMQFVLHFSPCTPVLFTSVTDYVENF
jgi:hypothetical protein